MSEDLLPGLREELVRAAWRAQRRHRWRRVTVGAVAAVAAASIALIAFIAFDSSDPAAAGVEVEIVNGRIEVLLTNLETRPAVVEAALRDVGLDATVTSLPVGPSRVGRFVADAGRLPNAVTVTESDGENFLGFSAPTGLADHLELVLGRPAEGEPYALASDAYGAGEPLSCSDVYGDPFAALVTFADDHPDLQITVQAFADTGPVGPPAPLAQADPSLNELRIADAISPAADTVTVYLTPDGESPFVEPLSPDQGACRE